MALFERFHLSQDEAEARLKRPLTGDPIKGEIGLIAALNADKHDEVQRRSAATRRLARTFGNSWPSTSRRPVRVGRRVRPGPSRFRSQSGTNTRASPA